MSHALPVFPFDGDRCIGTVIEVSPSTTRVNLPNASNPEGQWLYGHRLGAGEVGEFVFLECGEFAVFGRIMSVKLPERERLSVQPEMGKTREANPIGTIQMLATIAIRDGKVSGGVSLYPRLGAKAYSAHPSLIKWIAEAAQNTEGQANPLVVKLGLLPTAGDTSVNFTPERLFGRHCALLGATGGGKSWTIARLLEEVQQHNAKAVLLDATGEFYTLGFGVKHLHIGSGDPAPKDSTEVVFPYRELTEGDLFALFRPSGQAQGPRLRAAMKSLKLAKLAPELAPKGYILKASQLKAPYYEQYRLHAKTLEERFADFDIKCLTLQIGHECVWPHGGAQGSDTKLWGNQDQKELSYCIPLLTRIEQMLTSSELACIFRPESKASVRAELDSFFKSPDVQVIRISLRHLSFEYNVREIAVNAIGRHLLDLGRSGNFREKPVVVFLDEAHQFLNKQLGDENSRYPLDSFELIAKEGRKFSLNVCISTQRPRDVPEGVLSQMGTLIVHRLTNDKDREIVERASGEIDQSAAAFLPTLAPGQAIVIGVDLPMPLTVQVTEPGQKPDSRGPDYQSFWRSAAAATPVQAANESSPLEASAISGEVPASKAVR
jgi:hypothetical protein